MSLFVLVAAGVIAIAASPGMRPLARAVSEQASPGAPLRTDNSLDRVSARHAAAVLHNESAASFAELEAALRIEGLSDAQILPFASVGTDPLALEAAVLRFAKDQAFGRGPTHLGLGRAEVSSEAGAKHALVAVFVRRLVELPPLPARAKEPQLFVRGHAGAEARQLSGFLTLPSGDVVQLPIVTKERRFVLSVPLAEGTGSYVFELLAHTRRGPEVTAVWAFSMAAADPGPPKLNTPTEVSNDAELLLAINRLREEMRRGALVRSPVLDRAAAEHAAGVCRARLAVHILPGGEDPKERAQKAGYEGRVSENVAVAPSLTTAFSNLLGSPSHRHNMIDTESRRIGIGVSERGEGIERSVCVVQLFGSQVVPGER